MTQKQRNFYRYLTVIVDETKVSFLHLLGFYVKNKGITLQRFIEIKAHEIYHLCHNRYPCCQCPPGTPPHIKGSRVLHPLQLDTFLNPAGGKLSGHNPRSISSPHCCFLVDPNLQLFDLDFTMTRILLVNFTTLVPQGSLERNAFDFLVHSRNHSFAHAKEGKISKSEFQNSIADIEKSLLVLARVYGKETETKQKLSDIASQPLNTSKCVVLQKTLLQQCQLEEKITHVIDEKTIPDFFTKDLYDITVTEGCDAHFKIYTKTDECFALWSKDGLNISNSKKFKTGKTGKTHSLTVMNTCLSDQGLYAVRVNDIERQAYLNIEEYFTKNLQNVECIEEKTAEFICEVIEDSLLASWNKNGVHLKHNDKLEISKAIKSHRLSINNCDPHDTGTYAVSFNNRIRSTSLKVIEYYTKNLQSVERIEGETVEFTCEVIEESLPARWSKHGIYLKHEGKIEIQQVGRIYRLSITNCDLNDAGEYTVNVNNRFRKTSLSVKEYFTQNMDRNIECTEGENVQLSCAVLEDNFPAVWKKNGSDVHQSTKYITEDVGMMHKLFIIQANLQDAGEYTVIINNRKRLVSLHVKEIPAAIQQLSEKDRGRYLEIIKAGTETRYYIRIFIIGENGVGKTCLLRRLLGEPIDDVESTDGVDIVHRCKIRLCDGKWIFDGDKKKALLSRIRRAVKYNTSEHVKIEMKMDSQNNQPGTFGNNSKKWDTDGSSKNKEKKDKDSSQILNDREDAKKGIMPNADNDREIIEGLTAHDTLRSEDTLSKSHPIQVKMKLEKVLTETVLNELSEVLHDIETFDIPDDVLVDCGFWDFAGQRQYYPTHQIFLNPNAVHLLVVNIMKDLKQINNEVGYDKIGEYVDYWFDSVHSCREMDKKEANCGDYLHPPVIVVCTGIDNCKNNLEERKHEFRKGLISLLNNELKIKHLRRICLVSNIEPVDTDLNHLRQSIFEFGKEIKTFGEILPLRWIRLERSLDILREAGVNILSWTDMTDLSSKCLVDDENEIILFLKYQHIVGSIIYFESLKDNIILNQKWLADAFRCLVSDKVDFDITLTLEWKMLEDTGKLEPVLIEKLFQKDPELEFNKHQRHLLDVMDLFGIIVKLTTLLEDGQKQISSTYYMPCMVSKQASIVEMIKVFCVEKDNCKRTPWLCMEFEFMPLDFFNHILCYYISQYPICTEPSTKRVAIYHGMGVFYLDKTKLRKFVLCFSKNMIAIQLWLWGKEIEQHKYKGIMEELKSVILRVKDKYEPRKVSYIIKVKCSAGNIHTSDGRLSYRELAELEDEEYFCEEHSECHHTNHFFQSWFADYHDESEKMYVCVHGIDSEDSNDSVYNYLGAMSKTRVIVEESWRTTEVPELAVVAFANRVDLKALKGACNSKKLKTSSIVFDELYPPRSDVISSKGDSLRGTKLQDHLKKKRILVYTTVERPVSVKLKNTKDNMPRKKGHALKTGPVIYTNGTKVILVKEEDLGKQQADVIVCSMNRELNLYGSSAKSIVTVAGQQILNEIRTRYKDGIQYGEIAVVDGCNLQCKEVYMTALPEWSPVFLWSPFFKYIISKCINNCLTAAEQSQHSSIAFPCLGTGNLKYPRDLVAETMYRCVENFDKNNTLLKEVKFLCYDNDTIKAFENEESKILIPGFQPPVAGAKKPEPENYAVDDHWRKLIMELFYKTIINCVKASEIVAHLSSVFDMDEKISIRQAGKHKTQEEAMILLLDMLDKKNTPGKWSAFRTALAEADYDWIINILEGVDINHEEQQKWKTILSIFEYKLADKVIPSQIVYDLCKKDQMLISEQECEEILSEERYRGEKNAAFLLLTFLPKRHPQWYPRFLEVLFLNGLEETVQEIDEHIWKELNKKYPNSPVIESSKYNNYNACDNA